MGGENHWPLRPRPISSPTKFLFLSLFLHLLFFSNFVIFASAKGIKKPHFPPSPSPSPSSSPVPAFRPPDNYLINCGSPQQTKLPDGRTFKSDTESASFLQTPEDVQCAVDSISVNLSSLSPPSGFALYRTARIFPFESTYTFYVSKPGYHWVRLYFYPLPHPLYNLTTAVFSVLTDHIVLLHDFSVKDHSAVIFKEYLVSSTGRFSLFFKPRKDSCAFVNAIEVLSAPENLISQSASLVPQRSITGLNKTALQVYYRLNVGGKIITPKNDSLTRTWFPDDEFNVFLEGALNASVAPTTIKYPSTQGGATPSIAPDLVYATAEQMTEAQVMNPNFNLTWIMSVEPGYDYLIRLHFCDIVSKSLDDLVFNVYINGLAAMLPLDLSKLTGELSTAYYADFVLNSSAITNGSIMVQVGPAVNGPAGKANAILNGLEVMKMNNIAGSLDGLLDILGNYHGPGEVSSKMRLVAWIGLGMGTTALLGLLLVFVRWHRRPKDWQKKNSFSSWLLPLHSTRTSFLYSLSSSRRSGMFSSRKSKSYSSVFCNQGLGRFFTFHELQTATHNFSEKEVIGVGGFGKVYIGALEDGTKVAIKRGNSGSEQGINEFQTEIQMLSKLRHKHLVSLIGFCDEHQEMILVYEYMANGPLRDHLYGNDTKNPTLSWKQRLEICIGAARGLHYLHTGAAQGIIHRDVKTTNILLDENLVAKMSDFGLSKAAAIDQGHVSTAVKGSFGYLDPEYFRRQQLTEKSDVYSFGVVLFEVLCARAVICPGLPREQVSLAEWAMQMHRKGSLEKIIDQKISESINHGSLKKYVEAGEKCLAENGVDRPSMGDVLWNLEYALQLQEVSTQIDSAEDKSTVNFVAFEKNMENNEVDTSVSSVRDDSQVSSSPLFSQIANFQGR